MHQLDKVLFRPWRRCRRPCRDASGARVGENRTPARPTLMLPTRPAVAAVDAALRGGGEDSQPRRSPSPKVVPHGPARARLAGEPQQGRLATPAALHGATLGQRFEVEPQLVGVIEGDHVCKRLALQKAGDAPKILGVRDVLLQKDQPLGLAPRINLLRHLVGCQWVVKQHATARKAQNTGLDHWRYRRRVRHPTFNAVIPIVRVAKPAAAGRGAVSTPASAAADTGAAAAAVAAAATTTTAATATHLRGRSGGGTQGVQRSVAATCSPMRK